jgi:hypothetical protein
MKIAFCLYGIIGGTAGKGGIGGNVDYVECSNTYKKKIFDGNDVDTFIHTWSVGYERPLRNIYKPKMGIFQRQINFSKKDDPNQDKFRTFSRWYSNKRVLELQKEYSEKNNIEYDFIMVCRFDIIWKTKINFSELEKDIFYVSKWNQHKQLPNLIGNMSFPEGNHKRYMDLWFIGNQDQMNYLSGVYNFLEKEGGKYASDPHSLIFHYMYPKYNDRIKFKYNVVFDYILYRRYIGCRT